MCIKRFFILMSIIMTGCTSLKEGQSPFVEGDVALVSWPGQVQETSGLALHAGMRWTINDSGDDAVVYAINDDNKIEKKVLIGGAQNIDWESLAQDDRFLYIADCGNNSAHRSVVQIYKVSWRSLLQAETNSSVAAEKMNIRYLDFPRNKPGKNHNFDCEALTVVDEELWLFTKNRGDLKTKLYRLDKGKYEQAVLPDQEYDVGGLITGADFDPLSRRLVLLGYGKNVVFGQSFIWLIPIDELPVWKDARRIKLHPYAQWEAIAWHYKGDESALVLSSERSPLLDVSVGELKIVPQTEGSSRR